MATSQPELSAHAHTQDAHACGGVLDLELFGDHKGRHLRDPGIARGPAVDHEQEPHAARRIEGAQGRQDQG